MDKKYKYKKNWFLQSEIYKLILNHVNGNNLNNILEIGCYEGLSSVYFADNLLKHENSTLTLVDPFLNISNNVHKDLLEEGLIEKNFDYNITQCDNQNKITVHKITSDDFF